MSEFLVQQIGPLQVTDSGLNHTLPSAVSGLSSAIEFINNNRYQSGGLSPASNDLMSIGQIGMGVKLTSTSNLEFVRLNVFPDVTTLGTASVLDYVGNAGGDNEVIVRGRFDIYIQAGSDVTNVWIGSSGIANIDKVVPIITGWHSDDDSLGLNKSPIAVITDGTNMEVRRGEANASFITRAQIALVEFTGSNWSVHRADSNKAGSTSTDQNTGSINLYSNHQLTNGSTISNWNRAFILNQYMSSSNISEGDGLADGFPLVSPGTQATVDWEFQSQRSVSNTSRILAYVLENPEILVGRDTRTSNNAAGESLYEGSQTLKNNAANPPTTDNLLLIPQVIAMDFGSDDYPIGWRSCYFKPDNQIYTYCSRVGTVLKYNMQLVNFERTGIVHEADINVTNEEMTTEILSLNPNVVVIDVANEEMISDMIGLTPNNVVISNVDEAMTTSIIGLTPNEVIIENTNSEMTTLMSGLTPSEVVISNTNNAMTTIMAGEFPNRVAIFEVNNALQTTIASLTPGLLVGNQTNQVMVTTMIGMQTNPPGSIINVNEPMGTLLFDRLQSAAGDIDLIAPVN